MYSYIYTPLFVILIPFVNLLFTTNYYTYTIIYHLHNNSLIFSLYKFFLSLLEQFSIAFLQCLLLLETATDATTNWGQLNTR